MKTSTLILSFFFLSIFTLATMAESVIVKETTTWKSVPINVDTTNNTYTVVGTVPTDTTDYYYTYRGYRCFREKRSIVGVNAVVFNASVSGGSEIYCYAE